MRDMDKAFAVGGIGCVVLTAVALVGAVLLILMLFGLGTIL